MSIRAAEHDTAAAGKSSTPYRVMIADDSAVVRGLIAKALESDPEIEVAASVSNGEMAVNSVARHNVDVVILDIEMPVMDGLTALPKILSQAPGVKVIVASTLTLRNAEISLKCLSGGADDYIPKPSSTRDLSAADGFRRDLLEKVKALGAAKRGLAYPQPPAGAPTAATRASQPAPSLLAPTEPIALRRPSTYTPRVIAVGSSTGGPQALFKLFEALSDSIKVPILITQHMPPTFTRILAEHIERICGRPCCEGENGMPIEEGHVYLAPGDYHMVVRIDGDRKVLRLNQDPPENFCRPAVDPMLRSVAAAYGPQVLTLILTGMGCDGAAGSQAIAEAGGTVIGQDQATSVVWGMPGATAALGVCSAVVAIDDMGDYVNRFMARSLK